MSQNLRGHKTDQSVRDLLRDARSAEPCCCSRPLLDDEGECQRCGRWSEPTIRETWRQK